MRRIALIVFLIAISALGVWSLQPAQAPQGKVAYTLVRGRGAGHLVKLFASGRYERGAFCDVCPEHLEVGLWRETGTGYVLTPAGGQRVTLERVTFRGCRGLVVQGDAPPRFPTDVFFPASESCGDAL